MTNDQLNELASQLENWQPTTELPKHYPQFTASQLKGLLWRRDEHKGLSRCWRRVGKKGYINVPLFGLWMAGQLPEQQEA